MTDDTSCKDVSSIFFALLLRDKLKVKVTLKMLHSPDEDDLNQCVRQFSIQKLFNEDKKQTLACINIPTFIPPK